MIKPDAQARELGDLESVARQGGERSAPKKNPFHRKLSAINGHLEALCIGKFNLKSFHRYSNFTSSKLLAHICRRIKITRQ